MRAFPYPDYKDSGAVWLARVPSHWTVQAIKWLSPVRRGASPRPIDDEKYFDDEGEYAWVRIADVSAAGRILTTTTQRLSVLGSSLSVKLSPGALFVSIAGTVGKPCITGTKACVHDGFVYFPMLRINPMYLYWLFDVGACYGGLGKLGTQLNLNTDTIGSIKVPVPPPSEIEAIVRFLDSETAKIDALIAQQERLIELLQEKRQAVISDAVTRGLNPDVPMRDCGAVPVGEIPGHWWVATLKRFWDVLDCKHLTAEFTSEGVPVASIGEVKGRWVSLESARKTTADFAELLAEGGRLPLAGDLIFSRNATVGEVAEVAPGTPHFVMGQDVVLLRRRSAALSPAFAYWALRSALVTQQLDQLLIGSTFKRINVEELRHLLVAWPPPDEQQAVATYVEREVERFQRAAEHVSHSIELLHERRAALISAAVTGQIDVRTAEVVTA